MFKIAATGGTPVPPWSMLVPGSQAPLGNPLLSEAREISTGYRLPTDSLPAAKADWTVHEISEHKPGSGTRFDLIQLLDLDADGDLDVVTCEEKDNLGVVWYENPTR